MKERILALLQKTLPDIDFSMSDTLVDDGILDSFAIISIMAEISMEFGIMIPFEELESRNFNSVDNMAELVEKCLSGKNES